MLIITNSSLKTELGLLYLEGRLEKEWVWVVDIVKIEGFMGKGEERWQHREKGVVERGDWEWIERCSATCYNRWVMGCIRFRTWQEQGV